MKTKLIKALAAFALGFLALPANALDCLPTAWVPMPGTGTEFRQASTPAGTVYAWFCETPVMADGQTRWRPQVFPVLKKHENLTLFREAVIRVGAASDIKAAIQAELQAAKVTIEAGGPDDHEYRRLHYAACLELAKPPALASYGPLPADWCGVAPIPNLHVVSPYQGATHRATYATTAAFNGTRATLASGKVPMLTNGVPTPCSCTLGYVTERSVAGVTTTYCSVQGAARVVANCSRP